MTAVEDKLAILEMVAQYSHSYDDRDADGFAEVFLEHGVFEVFVAGQPRAVLRLQSRKDIRAWAARRLREREGQFSGRHYQSGILFDKLTRAQAHVRSARPCGARDRGDSERGAGARCRIGACTWFLPRRRRSV